MTRIPSTVRRGRSHAAWGLLALMLPLVGCSSVASWPAAIFEGNHYQVEEDRVMWVQFDPRVEIRLDPIYERTATRLPADPASFRILGDRRVAVDRDHVFCNGEILNGGDPASVRIVPTSEPSFLLADRDQLWGDCTFRGAVDGATFEMIEGGYGRDARHIYVYGMVVEGADPATFRVLTDRAGKAIFFGTDGRKFWFGGARIPVINPAGFRHLGDFFSTDGVLVFSQGRVLEGADLATFQVLKSGNARDRFGCWGQIDRLVFC